MLYPGLTCIVIVVSGLALTNGSYTQEVGETNSMSVPTVALRHKKHLDERNRYFQNYLEENGGQRRKVKNSHGLIRDLNLVILKLKNMVGKYDQKNKDLTTLYKGVTNYGLNNCGKFPFALPEKMESKAFKCKKFKRRRDLKKWTLEIFSKGYNDGSVYDEQFQKLIYYEKLRRFRKRYKNNGSRLTILQELQNEIRALNVEILDILHTKKRLNFSYASPTQTPESETDLMIKEWCTLQLSKDYLSQFCESLEVVVKCWERKRKWEWKKKNVSKSVLEERKGI